jgi:hypothetical protein
MFAAGETYKRSLWFYAQKEGHFSKVPLGPWGKAFIGGNKRVIAAAAIDTHCYT